MKLSNENIASHYQGTYFNNYQKEYGEFGGLANKFMFEKHIAPEHTVLDFGCGGGFLLKNLECRRKVGIEINPVAREYCILVNDIQCYESLEFVAGESVDVIIPSHCLEHSTNPFELVSNLFDKLKPGGEMIIVVPLDSYQTHWAAQDVNNHLYSFSPMNLGNIFQGVGLSDIRIEVVLHKWVPGWRKIVKVFGMVTFHQLSWIYGHLNKRRVQVKGYAKKL